MSADRDEVCAQRVRAERDLQKRLHRVGVEQCFGAACAEHLRGLGDGKNAAGLVVYKHHGHERRVLAQRIRDLLRGDISVLVGYEIGDGVSLLLKLAARLKHRAVLDGGGDDMPPPMAVLVRGEADGPVVALRAAGGEIKLLILAAKRGGNDRTVGLQPLFRGRTVRVLRAGVAAAVEQHIVHGIRHLARNGRGGGVIEIDHSKAIPFFALAIKCKTLYIIRRKPRKARRKHENRHLHPWLQGESI